MPYMARVEYHDRHALSVEFGLAGVELGDRGALGVGPITRDQRYSASRMCCGSAAEAAAISSDVWVLIALALLSPARRVPGALRGRLEGHP
jgi:hypothetical protein